jgi:hypothetical protein
MLANKVQAAAKVVSGGGGGTTYVAVSFSDSPYVRVYPWSNATGFGTAFANPASIGNDQNGVDFTNAGDAIVTTESGGVTAWQWSSAGFGTRLTCPFTSVSNTSVDVHPAGDAVAYTSGNNPYVHAYRFSAVTGFGTKYANPSSAYFGFGRSVRFNPAGNAVLVAGANGIPYFHVYGWTYASGFGSKYSNPATNIGSEVNVCTWNAAGDVIAFASQSTPSVHAYPFSVATGIGAKFANPAVLMSTGAQGVCFNPAGDVIAASGTYTGGTVRNIHAWAWSAAGFGTKFADPSTPVNLSMRQLLFSPDGGAIVGALQFAPCIVGYAWSAAGFGAKYSDPATLPTGSAYDVAFVTV